MEIEKSSLTERAIGKAIYGRHYAGDDGQRWAGVTSQLFTSSNFPLHLDHHCCLHHHPCRQRERQRYQSLVHSYVFGPKRASKSNPPHTLLGLK